MRKLIQISSAASYDPIAKRMIPILFGLSDDGSAWVLKSGENEKWMQIPAIPQPSEPKV